MADQTRNPTDSAPISSTASTGPRPGTVPGLYPGSPKADLLGQLINRCEAGSGELVPMTAGTIMLRLNRGTEAEPHWESWRAYRRRTINELRDGGLIETTPVTYIDVVVVTDAGRAAYEGVRR